MTVYTAEWKKMHEKVSKAKSTAAKYTQSEADELQKAKNYQAQKDSASATIKDIEHDEWYYTTTDKKTKKKVTKRRKKAKTLSATEKKNLANARSQYSSADKALTKLKGTKTYKQAKAKRDKATQSVKSAEAALSKYEEKRHAQAMKRVNGQIAQNYDRFMAPHAVLHATNSLTGLTVFIFATSEADANTNTVTQYPIDSQEPVVDHSRPESKTITISGYLFGQEAAERLWGGSENDVSGSGLPHKTVQAQYRNILDWMWQGTELVYKSDWANEQNATKANHIYWKHCVISDFSKTLEKPYKDVMPISMTLTVINKAMAKTYTTPVKNNKGQKTLAGTYVGAKYITVKYGMTYWDLAKKYHTTVSQLRKWNGSEKVTMYPDKKTGKYPKKLRVTEGTYVSKKMATGGYKPDMKKIAEKGISSILKKIGG